MEKYIIPMARFCLVALLTAIELCFINGTAYAQSDGLPRGAYDMPYTRYESENATRGGGAVLHSSPEYRMNEIASEASDQKYVALPGNGSSVSWTMTNSGAGFNMRFTMPDSPGGVNGLTGSLNLYVNNVMVKTINLSSYWAHQYFNLYEHDPKNTPAPLHFMRFDEVHFRLDSKVNSGDVVKIQKDNGDGLEYGVDFIEIEEVPASLPKPAGYFSVTDYGAVPNDGNDDLEAFNSAVAAADAANTGIYIPEGTFTLADCWRVNASNMGIKGAGMWYSNLYYSTNAFFSGGLMSRSTGLDISDFSVNTANNIRWENGVYRVYKCFMGTYGTGSKIQRIWQEHFECGMWIGGYDEPYPIDVTSNLLVSHCRIRNNYADGINFCQGTNNSTIEFCSVRNNGDDGLASWPAKDMGNTVECSNLIFKNNTIENNWRAGSIGIFGGRNHQIHHNYIKDGVAGSGIRFTTEFSGFHFENNTEMKVYENTIISCGTSTDLVDQEKGAIEIYAAMAPITNLTFTNNDIINAQRHGVILGAGNLDNIIFNNLTINGTGLDPETKSAFAAPSGGYGIFCFSQSGTSTFNNLVMSNIEETPPTYKGNQAYNLIINSGPPTAVTGVSISPASVSIAQGQTAQLIANVSPANATNKNVTWASSNSSVASINASGLVSAVAAGTTTITVTTQDGGFTSTRTVTVTAGAPVISSSGTASGTVNTSFNYSITASNSPTSYGATGLPSGLSVNTSTGVISGTPTSTGTFNANVSATNSGGTGSKPLTITINAAPSAPVVSSSGTANGAVGVAFSYNITASGNPTSYGATGLPAGLSVNTSTGTISGTPSSTGTFNATVSATNSIGTGSKPVVITINTAPPCAAPFINFTTSAPAIDQSIDASWSSAAVGSINNVTIGSMPADFAGSQWRASYDNTNLYVLVEVKDAGKFNDSGSSWWEDDVIELFIDGNNSKGTSYDGVNDFQLGFRYNDPVVKVGGNSVNHTMGITFAIQNVAGGYNLEAKIPWSTIGITPSAGNQIGFDISVDDDDNGGVRDSQISAFATTSNAWSNPGIFGTVNLCNGTQQPQTPVVSSSGSASGTVGSAFSYSITASNNPTSYGATGLPAGLTVNTSSGMISGTPSTAGTYSATVNASNSAGTGSKALTITITPSTPPAPVVSSAGTTNGTVGTAFTYSITASNNPTSYGATGLPAGLSVNTSTGAITGTPTTAGTFNATVSATNSGGTGSKSLTITISGSSSQTPYGGTVRNIPGTIQSEDYDNGGQSIAYNDNEALNNGGQYRSSEGVDIEVSSEGGYNVGWTAAGEWIEHTVNVVSAGTYTLQARVASPNSGKSFHLEINGVNISGTIAIPNTGGWQNWQTITVTTTSLTTGQKVIRTVMDTDGFNLNYVNFVFNGTVTAPVVSSAGTATGTVGSAFNYSITASNNPTSYGATGLPAGLSLNATTGVISGTPSTAGTYNATVTATNSTGTGSKSVTITIAPSIGDPAGVITAYRAPGTITVNGTLNEAGWNVTRQVSKATIGNANNTVTFGVLWDNTNLYIGAKVLDATLNSDSPNMWENDAIEIYIDANNNKLTSYDGNDNQFIKQYNNSGLFIKTGITGVQHGWTAISGGYSVEISIPWSQLGLTPTAGLNIGFDIGNDDDDNGGARDAQVVWHGGIDNYANTSGFGVVTLNAANSTARQALDEIDSSFSVILSPNPVTDGMVKVLLPELSGEVNVQIRNAQGIMVYEGKRQINKASIDLDVSDFKSGAFILQLHQKDLTITKRFIVQ